MRFFLGLAGYYWKFVNGYSRIAAPLTDLTKAKQPNKIKWNDEAIDAFNQLKQALCEAPILQLPDVIKPFVLRRDASDTGLGAVLRQECHEVLFPVAFASKNQRKGDIPWWKGNVWESFGEMLLYSVINGH